MKDLYQMKTEDLSQIIFKSVWSSEPKETQDDASQNNYNYYSAFARKLTYNSTTFIVLIINDITINI